MADVAIRPLKAAIMGTERSIPVGPHAHPKNDIQSKITTSQKDKGKKSHQIELADPTLTAVKRERGNHLNNKADVLSHVTK